jgi:predicted RNA-binding Zn-ribbon protein involved in translation (DUF1610 family)
MSVADGAICRRCGAMMIASDPEFGPVVHSCPDCGLVEGAGR